MHRFYWLIEDVLAGCSRPGAYGGDVDRDLASLRGHGVNALLTLTETPLPNGALDRHGLSGLHLPVDDFHAPTTTQMLDALAFLDEARATSAPAAVHCLAGQGRTGTVLAAVPHPRRPLRGAGDRRGAHRLPGRYRGRNTDDGAGALGRRAAVAGVIGQLPAARHAIAPGILMRRFHRDGSVADW